MQGRKIRNYFIAGLFSILPLTITGYLINIGFRWTDNILGQFIQRIIGKHVPGLGLFFILILITILGVITTNLLGRRLVTFFENVIQQVPLVGNIYNTTKQITDAISSTDKSFFRSVVMIEYPRKGVFTPGFRVGEPPVVIIKSEDKREQWISVFIPTTPNPTTGFMVFVPESEAIQLPMTVEEGFKYFLSAGVVRPKNGNARQIFPDEV